MPRVREIDEPGNDAEIGSKVITRNTDANGQVNYNLRVGSTPGVIVVRISTPNGMSSSVIVNVVGSSLTSIAPPPAPPVRVRGGRRCHRAGSLCHQTLHGPFSRSGHPVAQGARGRVAGLHLALGARALLQRCGLERIVIHARPRVEVRDGIAPAIHRGLPGGPPEDDLHATATLAHLRRRHLRTDLGRKLHRACVAEARGPGQIVPRGVLPLQPEGDARPIGDGPYPHLGRGRDEQPRLHHVLQEQRGGVDGHAIPGSIGRVRRDRRPRHHHDLRCRRRRLPAARGARQDAGGEDYYWFEIKSESDDYGPRRVPGLRREELAQLAGVSHGYYTRLEQDQAGTASQQVLDALARVGQVQRPVR